MMHELRIRLNAAQYQHIGETTEAMARQEVGTGIMTTTMTSNIRFIHVCV